MEVNEDLGFGENQFHGSSLNNNSSIMLEKRHYSTSHVIMELETNMMIRRKGEDDNDDDDDEDDRRQTLFPTFITTPGQAPPTTNINTCNNVFSPNSASCYSNDTVLDSIEVLDVHRHHHMTVMAERKLRRMISNRESARRSRMRKKKQIEELQYQVGQLEVSNRQLSEKLIELLECNQQIVHENAELKRKVSSLQIILTDMLTPSRNFGDGFGNSNRRAETNSNPTLH